MNRIKLALAAGLLAISAGMASAAPVTLTYSQDLGKRGVQITNPVGSITNPSAGPFTMTEPSGQSSTLGLGSSFVAWCLDLATRIASPRLYELTTAPFGDYELSPAVLTNIGKLFDSSFGTFALTDNDKAAGFQVALWSIAYAGSSPAFAIGGPSAVVTQANNFLAAASGYAGPRKYNLHYLESIDDGNKSSQNLVTATVVPLPAAAWLMLGALGALAAMRRQRTAAA